MQYSGGGNGNEVGVKLGYRRRFRLSIISRCYAGLGGHPYSRYRLERCRRYCPFLPIENNEVESTRDSLGASWAMCFGLHSLSRPALKTTLHHDGSELPISWSVRLSWKWECSHRQLHDEMVSGVGKVVDFRERWSLVANARDELRLCKSVSHDVRLNTKLAPSV